MINDSLDLVLHRMDLEVRGLSAPTKDAILVHFQMFDYSSKLIYEQYIWVSNYDAKIYWYRWSSDFAADVFHRTIIRKKQLAHYGSYYYRVEEPNGKTYNVDYRNGDYFRKLDLI